MIISALKRLLPDSPVLVPILRGPFRGARIVMNPRNSLRKIFGFYEHELNEWLSTATTEVERVVDVGANDGYFTFGCLAAFARQGRTGRVLAFEPQPCAVAALRQSLDAQPDANVPVEIVEMFVGNKMRPDMTTLDALGDEWPRRNTLIKVDVEGAEVDVMAGAITWLEPSNRFVIEVHHPALFAPLQKQFANHGLTLIHVKQRPIPILGGETREENNGWLLSDVAR